MIPPIQAAKELDVHQLRRILNEPGFFQLIFDALPLMVVVKSARPETFGQFLLWNRVAEEWLGLMASEVIGRTDHDFFPPEQAEFFRETDRGVVRARRTVDVPDEPILSRTLGERFIHTVKTPIYDDEGEPLALLNVSEDITERKLSDEAMRESEERWLLALAGSEGGVWDWNIRSGELFYSERWREMFGFAEAELPRSTQELLELIHAEDRAAVRQHTRDLLRRKIDLFRCEYRMRCRGGGYKWILAHAKAHFDAAARPTRMIGTLIDISDRKLVEAQLVEAKEAAESASRAKSDFLAMMSHEIRTPLNGVLGFADLLGGTTLQENQREYVHTIRESGSNLLHVLNDILDYSKIEAGKLALDSQPTVLREVVESAAETFRAKADAKGLDLLIDISPGTPRVVSVDALRLQQVLMNLVSNAVKFTSIGSVKITVAPLEAVKEPDGASLRFTVADTGIGMSGEDLPRLFEPFEQHDISMVRRFGGTGLGLAIVQRLVGMMNGRISATSAPDEGTTFIVDFTLPVLTPAPAPPLTTVRAARTKPSSPASILLVEDNPVNRRLARLMLERIGYSPDEAEDGLVAVELARQRRYDVILMDIQMPGMDGYEAATRILEMAPRICIVALTAHAMPADRERSTAHGMFLHLTKPVRIDELRDALAACAARASQTAASD